MLDKIYIWAMNKVYRNKNPGKRPLEGQFLAKIPQRMLLERVARSNEIIVEVQPCDELIFQVDTKRPSRRTVDLRKHTCTCNGFQEYQSPCAHALAAIKYLRQEPTRYFHKAYSLQEYRATYEATFKPVDIFKLAVNPDQPCYPPEHRKQPGRPKVQRIRRDATWKKKRICSRCLEKGHNSRTCPNEPVLDGKAQKARERRMTRRAVDINGEIDLEDDTDQPDESDLDTDDETPDWDIWLDDVCHLRSFTCLDKKQQRQLIFRRRKEALLRTENGSDLSSDSDTDNTYEAGKRSTCYAKRNPRRPVLALTKEYLQSDTDEGEDKQSYSGHDEEYFELSEEDRKHEVDLDTNRRLKIKSKVKITQADEEWAEKSLQEEEDATDLPSLNDVLKSAKTARSGWLSPRTLVASMKFPPRSEVEQSRDSETPAPVVGKFLTSYRISSANKISRCQSRSETATTSWQYGRQMD